MIWVSETLTLWWFWPYLELDPTGQWIRAGCHIIQWQFVLPPGGMR